MINIALPPKKKPLAYFLTFTCYGHRVFGDAAGSVDRWHNRRGAPDIPAAPGRAAGIRERMMQPAYQLDEPRRIVVLTAVRETCAHRGWRLLAAHARETHVHLVAEAEHAPERVLTDLKAYASRALNRAGYETSERIRWARHGSTVYLWKPEDVRSAVIYVVEEQGIKMAVWHAPDLR
jgi:REP element-mobilizing transposase RayT